MVKAESEGLGGEGAIITIRVGRHSVREADAELNLAGLCRLSFRGLTRALRRLHDVSESDSVLPASQNRMMLHVRFTFGEGREG